MAATAGCMLTAFVLACSQAAESCIQVLDLYSQGIEARNRHSSHVCSQGCSDKTCLELSLLIHRNFSNSFAGRETAMTWIAEQV